MKIVLTGGPSAGKTTTAEVLARAYGHQLKMVPEAASILFRGGFPRGKDQQSVFWQQTAIYHVQKSLEATVGLSNPQGLICDRGSLDGLAYWLGEDKDYFTAIGSTLQAELDRYDWVIHLDTAEVLSYSVTSTRVENHQMAEEINDRVKAVWAAHPRRIVIANSTDFDKKIYKAILIVGMILNGKNYEEIQLALKERIYV